MRTQKRWKCHDCQREWIYKTALAGPVDNCPACGSQWFEQITFTGLFDINTPPAVSEGIPEAPAPVKRDSVVLDPPMTLQREDLWRP
jgi:hypothetical protein